MYLNFFGFSEEPFSSAPDPHFLYLSHSHSEVLSSMISVIRERIGIITITGEVGTGKTTLIYTLLKDLDEKVKTAFVFNPRIGFKDLLKTILRDLGVPVAEDHLYALLQIFNLYLKERLPFDETVAIIIDEAQTMDTEVLEGVNRLSKRGTPASELLQIILVGQPELEENLDSADLKEFKKRIAIRRQISPLSHAESKSYIDHRLKIVGSSSSKVFTAEAVELICKYADGIPRVINQLCDKAFLIGYALSTPIIDSKIVKDAIRDMSYLIPRKTIRFPDIKPIYKIISFIGVVGLGLGFFYLINQDWNKKTPLKEPLVYKYKINNAQLEVKAKNSPLKDHPVKEREGKIVKVQKGWTLSLLAQRYYHSTDLTFLDLILEANPQITNANIIHINDEIKIPAVTEESLLIQSPEHEYKIYIGTFSSPQLSKKYENLFALKGKKLQVLPRKVSQKETWYRVFAENFETKEKGIEAIRILKGKGLLPALSGSSVVNG